MPTGSERSAAGLVIALLSSVGCVLFEEPDIEVRDQERHDLAEFAGQVDDKLRMFAGCRDALASAMHESWERYTDQVEIGGKPKRRRDGVYIRGITDSTFRGCRRLLANVSRINPTLPAIEQTTTNLVGYAEQYGAETRAIESYLDKRTASDDWAGLADADTRLRAAHDRWLEADRALIAAIDTRHLENDPVLLGVLEDQRSSLELDTRRLMIRARLMVRCLTREPTPAASECKSTFDAFDIAYTLFATSWTADRVAADKVFWMRTFAADAAELYQQASQFHRDLAAGRVAKGDVDKLLDSHAGLARDFDTLDFEFP